MGQKRKGYKDQKRIEKETKQAVNNVCLYSVSGSFSSPCNSEKEYDSKHNETYCKECGKCV